jgi:hypothetical protein
MINLILGRAKLVQDRQGLLHLGVHGLGIVKKMDELRVIHLEQHASNFASQLRLCSKGTGVNENIASS